MWDSSLVLAKYLERTYHPNGLTGRRVIELGSGCGLVGIAAGATTVSFLMVMMKQFLIGLVHQRFSERKSCLRTSTR